MESKTLYKIPHLPPEIITEILSRLSVKSLLKLKSTSKSWHSLISSEHFIKTHLENSEKNPISANHRILSVVKKPNYELKHFSLRPLLYEQATEAKRGDFPIDKSVHSLKLVGSCNGLICILINKKIFFLWNPVTAESKKLPDLDVSVYISERGFGFDKSSGDYKVYAVSSRRPTIGNIYSLKTDSWTRINNDLEDGYTLGSKTGTFLSGNLHWTITSKELNWRWCILSLDLKNEVFGIMEQPSDAIHVDFDPLVGVLDGCLSTLYYYPDDGYLEFWVLKQYGVKESWSKLMTVSHQDYNDAMDMRPLQSFVISPNERVLFKYGSVIGIAVYNPKENRVEDPKILAFDQFLNSDIYVESLVSLNC
ncbi:hypothetical protein CDL12_10607 [Handroanthus impetiginosus]|uniref:F-box domain-containing protein n=1 Tax=Handroanthus impetiginosus TaxID=429701 RepID=A0A2G9HGT7_9LAMI|nr:hypothetical protein CDL12_10607 [Handroanthus impetiginosus]